MTARKSSKKMSEARRCAGVLPSNKPTSGTPHRTRVLRTEGGVEDGEVVVVVAAERLVVVGVAERQDSWRRRRHGRGCSLVFSKKRTKNGVSVLPHQPLSWHVRMAEARLSAHGLVARFHGRSPPRGA